MFNVETTAKNHETVSDSIVKTSLGINIAYVMRFTTKLILSSLTKHKPK